MAGNFSIKASFDGTELVQGFKDVKKEVADLTTEGQKAGKSLGEMLGQKNATSNYARQLSQLKQELTDLSVNYSKLTAAERESDFGKNMAARIETLRTKAIDLKNVMDDVALSLKGSTAEMGESIPDFGQQWSDVQRQTEQTRAKFESIQKISAGVASGFAAIQGAAALLGGENENLQRTLIKVQSAMAIAQGIGGIKDLIEGFSQAKLAFANATNGLKIFRTETVATTTTMNTAATATAVATKGVNTFKAALIKTGIGAIIVAIGYALAKIIEHWDTICEKLGLGKKKTEEMSEATKNHIEREKERTNVLNTSVGTSIAKYKMLQTEWNNLSTAQQQNSWISENASKFDELGLSVSNVADAQRVFVEYSDLVIQSIMAQAKANAMARIYEEALVKQYTAREDYNAKSKRASEMYKSGYKPTDDEADLIDDDSYWNPIYRESSLVEQLFGADKYQTDRGNSVSYAGAQELSGANAARAELNNINTEVAALEAEFISAQTSAEALRLQIQGLGSPQKGVTTAASAYVRTLEDEKRAYEASIAEYQQLYDNQLINEEEFQRNKKQISERYIQNIINLEGGITNEQAEQIRLTQGIIAATNAELERINAVNRAQQTAADLVEQKAAKEREYSDSLSNIAQLERDGILSAEEAREEEYNAAKKYYDYLITNWPNLVREEQIKASFLKAEIDAYEELLALAEEYSNFTSDTGVERGRTVAYRNYKAQEANTVVEEFKAGIITEDVAQQAIDAINADLESLQLKPLEININTDEAISGLEAFVSSADGILASINSVANVVGSIDAAYQAFHDMDEAMADAENGWERFMVGFNAGMQVLNIFTTVLGTINTLMTTFNTIQAISTALKKKDAIASGEKAAADIAAAGASATEAGANTAAAVSGAAKSVSWIPIVGAVLAVAAIAAVIGGIMAASNKAKFATGGIVPGSGIGDMDLVRVNGGEMILNGRQQKNLFNLIDQNRLPQTNTPSGEVTFRIQGDTLIGVIDNYNKKRSRA